jgi:hypothetical protein
MTTPSKLDMIIYQGATFSKVIKLSAAGVPMNITGYTFRMQVRQSKSPTSPILVELTTANNGIITTNPATLGEITLLLSATATASLNFPSSFYDLEMVNGSVVTRLIEGSITLSKEVTQ